MLDIITNKFNIKIPVLLLSTFLLLLQVFMVWQGIKIFDKLISDTTVLVYLRNHGKFFHFCLMSKVEKYVVRETYGSAGKW